MDCFVLFASLVWQATFAVGLTFLIVFGREFYPNDEDGKWFVLLRRCILVSIRFHNALPSNGALLKILLGCTDPI